MRCVVNLKLYPASSKSCICVFNHHTTFVSFYSVFRC